MSQPTDAQQRRAAQLVQEAMLTGAWRRVIEDLIATALAEEAQAGAHAQREADVKVAETHRCSDCDDGSGWRKAGCSISIADTLRIAPLVMEKKG